MALITAQELLDENHIDSNYDEIATMNRLIHDASALIRGSISDSVTDEQIMDNLPDQYNSSVEICQKAMVLVFRLWLIK